MMETALIRPRHRDNFRFHSTPVQILLFTFILVTFFFSIKTGFALSPGSYIDVPENHPYSEPIKYFSERGIVGGTGGGRFQPDRKISKGEYAAILMRTFYPEGSYTANPGEAWSSQYEKAAIEKKLLKNEGEVTRKEIAVALIHMSELEYYPAWCYLGSETPHTDDEDAFFAAKLSGLISWETDPMDVPTRGEVLQQLYTIIMEKLSPICAPELSGFPDILVLDEGKMLWKTRNMILTTLSQIPYKFLLDYMENGWSFRVTSDLGALYPEHPDAIGMTSPHVKYITIDCMAGESTVYHELGHYLRHRVKSSLELSQLYQLESDAIASLTRSYAKTNPEEMFAEAFRYVLCKRGDKEEYQKMQEKMPYTLALIEDGFLDAEGCFDLKAIQTVLGQVKKIS